MMSSGRDNRESDSAGGSLLVSRRDVLAGVGLGFVVGTPRFAAAAAPDQLTWGVHVSLAPTWFEPAEASGIITPFMVLYTLHDAMVKPMARPLQNARPCSSRSSS
jgi:peptide/nickel transport system substrate-binding protein